MNYTGYNINVHQWKTFSYLEKAKYFLQNIFLSDLDYVSNACLGDVTRIQSSFCSIDRTVKLGYNDYG